GDPQFAARLQPQVHPAHGGHPAGVRHGQVPDLQQTQRDTPSLGLRTDSTARPQSVNASATPAMARPGGTRYHQWPELTAPASRASCSRPPHETTVGSLSPRNASVASARIADEMIRVVWASTSGITLGSTCRLMTCQCPPPSARARSM